MITCIRCGKRVVVQGRAKEAWQYGTRILVEGKETAIHCGCALLWDGDFEDIPTISAEELLRGIRKINELFEKAVEEERMLREQRIIEREDGVRLGQY